MKAAQQTQHSTQNPVVGDLGGATATWQTDGFGVGGFFRVGWPTFSAAFSILNGFSIAVAAFCINCYNEFISQPSKWLRWRLSVSMCMPIRQYGYHGSLRAVWPVLICNCQLAVRGDSRIDSVLSLLISILIVAFGDSWCWDFVGCFAVDSGNWICNPFREMEGGRSPTLSAGSWAPVKVVWIRTSVECVWSNHHLCAANPLAVPSNIPSIVCRVICEISHKQSIHFPIIYWCLCVELPHCSNYCTTLAATTSAPAINL